MTAPSVTLMLLCYRQEGFVADAVASALEQVRPITEWLKARGTK